MATLPVRLSLFIGLALGSLSALPLAYTQTPDAAEAAQIAAAILPIDGLSPTTATSPSGTPAVAPAAPTSLGVSSPTEAAGPITAGTTETAGPAGTTTVTWQNNPLAVPLLVGKERRIDFPEPIAELDIPKDVEGQSQIVLAPTGTVHWTAKAPFSPVRVLATSVSGTLYQLQVEAGRDGAAPGPLVIVDPVLEAAKSNPLDDRRRLERAASALLPPFLKKDAVPGEASGPNYATLARFALAHYTGPARLIPKLAASRITVHPLAAARWVRLQGGALQTRPLAQWKIDPWYVTAVSVVNTSPFPVPFEPRALRGDFRFVATLHPTLGPQGSGHNGTIWAMVTDQPFNQAVSHNEFALTPRR